MATSMEGSSIGQASAERKCVKILLLGDFSIGKTTLIKTYLNVGEIPDNVFNIIEEHRTIVRHNGKLVDVALFDVRHGPMASERRAFYPTGVNAILLCFSIGHYESLRGISNLWLPEARAHYRINIPTFLVGLRSDLRESDAPIEVRSNFKPIVDRIAERSEAENVHRQYDLYGEYMECSSHDRPSVVNVISEAIFAALRT